MTTVTGKHKEILIELLIHYLNQADYIWDTSHTINNIKAQNEEGQWYINHYIDKGDKLP